jgi:glycosyltransferase involved in cell wall biosynthesis
MEAWERYERGISALDAVVCLTKHDQSLLTEVAPGARFFVIPPAGPPVPAASSIATGTSGAVLFVGNYIHPPNVEAALRLGRKIFPEVLARHPQATLQLVGAGPPPALRELASKSVEIPGRVTAEDLDSRYISPAAVVAVPVQSGAGLRTKMLAALAAGKAIVASALAAEGLDIRNGKEYLLAETDREFADAIISVLTDSKLRYSLERNARQWAIAYDQPGRVGAAFEAVYRDLDSRRAEASPLAWKS